MPGGMRSRRGAIIVMVGVMFMAIVAISAVAIDFSRLWSVKNELETSADAAALAGAIQFIGPRVKALADSFARAYASTESGHGGDGLGGVGGHREVGRQHRHLYPGAPDSTAIHVVVSRQSSGLIMNALGSPESANARQRHRLGGCAGVDHRVHQAMGGPVCSPDGSNQHVSKCPRVTGSVPAARFLGEPDADVRPGQRHSGAEQHDHCRSHLRLEARGQPRLGSGLRIVNNAWELPSGAAPEVLGRGNADLSDSGTCERCKRLPRQCCWQHMLWSVGGGPAQDRAGRHDRSHSARRSGRSMSDAARSDGQYEEHFTVIR